MKYIVNLNGKQYEVEVTETEAAVVSVTENVPASPAVQPAAPVSPADDPRGHEDGKRDRGAGRRDR